MSKLIAFYKSSLGKKILMSLTGLFLCTFLTEHFVGNLLLFKEDGGRAYEAYTELLVGNPVIRFIEIFLFAGLILHAFLGVVVWWKNRTSRSHGYVEFRLKDNTPFASRITIWTGSMIFIFLVIHLNSFFVPSRLTEMKVPLYELVAQAFQNPWYDGFYLIALVLLGYHLKHGFQSGFQTLGLLNKKYSTLVNLFGMIFWLIIPLGFALMPLYFLLIHKLGPSAMTIGAY
ncbi:MAG TPA: succinate dehydrogenase cytochrome b subunit [Bacteroidota bacterium]